jgi:hypothetical protein
MPPYGKQVFLNVPLDNRYRKLLHALVFVVQDCGLVARCALERDDGGEVRLEKIFTIIEDCRFGIHDLSRTTLDSQNHLPRFNMPLELGVFLGIRRFGGPRQRFKTCLILDKDRYRYQVFCSDISGQDIRAHSNRADTAIAVVRNWLQANLPASTPVKGPSILTSRYVDFRRQLPTVCRHEGLSIPQLTFLDYRTLVEVWVDENPK